MAGINTDQNMAEEEFCGISTDFPSTTYEGDTLEEPCGSHLGDLEPDKWKQHKMTSDLIQAPDSAAADGEKPRSMVCSFRQERLLESFRQQAQGEAKVRRKMQTVPCRETAMFIDDDVLQRWRQVGRELGQSSDSEIAAHLLSRYDGAKTKASGDAHLCSSCQTPLTLVCLTCNPAQSKYEEDAVPPTVEDGNGSDIPHREEDDSDSHILSAAKDVFFTTESVSVDGETSQEEDADRSANTSLLSPRAGCEIHPECEEISFSVTIDKKISDRCFVKITDISSERCVKELQEEGLLSPVETEKVKGTKTKKCDLEILPNKTDVKKNKKSVFKAAKQANLQPQVFQAADKKLINNKRRGRPKNETLSHVSEKVAASEDCSSHRAHELNHADKRKVHKCEHCSAAFRTRGNLMAHSRKHTGERPFSCEDCGKSFARSTTLEQHRRVHTNDCPYKCKDCGEAFKQRGMVIIHRRKVHTLERPFSCSVCGASFVVKGHLQVHMQSHTDHRPYLCEECGASFKQKGILKTHKLIHTGVRPFSCDICFKAFYRQVDVRSHKKAHFNIRSVMCTVCGAAFGNNSRLKRHMQKHTGFRPFECSECEKKFASSSELKVHLRIHTGDKPYICDVCHQGFQTMGNMKKHRKNRHKHAPPYNSTKPKTDPVTPEDESVTLVLSSDSNPGLLPSDAQKAKLLMLREQNEKFSSSVDFEKDTASETEERPLTCTTKREGSLSLPVERLQPHSLLQKILPSPETARTVLSDGKGI